LVVDIETIQHAVRELVITGSVIGVLEALCAHAHDDIIRTACFVTAEYVKVVQIGGLVIEQQRSVPVTGGERGRTNHKCEPHGTPGV
jgi:hypothetical protein